MNIFTINIPEGIANSILLGIIPIRGIFDLIQIRSQSDEFPERSLINYIMNKCFIICFRTVDIYIFLLGICYGIYTMIAPQFRTGSKRRILIARKSYKPTLQTSTQYNVQNSLQKQRTQTELKLSKTKEDPLAANKRRAFYMAIHLHNYRQLLGVNTIVAFGGIMIQSINSGLSLYANLLLNGIQGIVTIPSTFYIGKKVGRRPLYLWSGPKL